MKNKKSLEIISGPVIVLIALAFFLIIYLAIITGFFGKGASGLNERFNSAGDADNDGVINVADKCPCPPKTAGEKRLDDMENSGCPYGYKIDKSKKEYEDRWCFEKPGSIQKIV